MFKRLCSGLLLCVLWAVVPARAQDPCEPDCVEVGDFRVSVGLGLGMRSNPLHQGEDIPLLVLPEVSYYGERFFLDNLEMGFTLFEDRRHQFNLLVTPGYDQMYFNRWDPFNFTGSGGFFPYAASTPPTTAASYSVNISSQPAPMDAAGPGPGPSGSPSSATVYVPQAERVLINDQEVLLGSGPQALRGVDGNIITVNVSDSSVDIHGVAPGDRVVLEGVTGGSGIQGRAGADLKWDNTDIAETTDDPQRVSVGVNGQNSYLLSAEASVAAEQGAQGAPKIAADAVAHRKMAGLAGIEYAYNLAPLSLHLQALTDFTRVHEGHEVRMAIVFPWQWGEQRWALTLGANYKSREILNYYYGVDARDTSDPTFWFDPMSAGTEQLVRLDWQRPLSRHWSLRAMMQYMELPREIQPSPLVSDHSVGTVFFGGIYHF